MKLKVNIGELLEAVTQTAATLDRKGSVSGRMYFRAVNKGEDQQFLYLYATNMIAETLTKIPAKVEEIGEVLIDHHKLQDGLSGIGRELEVNLSLTPTGGTLKAQCGKTKFSAAASADVGEIANRIKAMPLGEPSTVKMPANVISEFVKRGLFCIACDETGQNANLTGLKIFDPGTGPEAMATDLAIAVRIHVGKKSQGMGLGIVIPHPSLAPLNALVNRKKGEDAEIILPKAGNKIFFKFGDTVYGTLTLAAAFPNLRPIIDSSVGKYTFDIHREALRAALTRASSFIGYRRTIELELKDGELGIKAKGDSSEGDLTDAVEISYHGDKPTESVKIAVGIDYLINVATATRSQTLNIGMTKHDQPLIIIDSEGEGEDKVDTKYVLMGVSVGKQ